MRQDVASPLSHHFDIVAYLGLHLVDSAERQRILIVHAPVQDPLSQSPSSGWPGPAGDRTDGFRTSMPIRSVRDDAPGLRHPVEEGICACLMRQVDHALHSRQEELAADRRREQQALLPAEVLRHIRKVN